MEEFRQTTSGVRVGCIVDQNQTLFAVKWLNGHKNAHVVRRLVLLDRGKRFILHGLRAVTTSPKLICTM